uniref:Lipase maturation factor n=1 Tax=Gouania willdenowi TaxID=441366 RepID=A0A8C5DUA9_GOUWI
MVSLVTVEFSMCSGLYGNEGLLPARLQLRYGGRSLTEQLRSSPTLLWLGPHLSLDTQASMELLCLLGALLSLAALLVEALRDSLVFLCLWVSYLSMYQVSLWDSLLLETGFLTVLVAPLTLVRGSRGIREHDSMTFWLVRWLLFRLMFVSGAVKLTSRCPTWWGLTALTYHYETQCIPTPLAWFAHQLPVWWHKLSVVATFVIEIAAPFLFFSPLRRLRLGAFYLQVLLQTLIILSGNYNFFNLLTLTLCLSLLDNQHVNFWLRKRDDNRERKEGEANHSVPKMGFLLCLFVCFIVEVSQLVPHVSVALSSIVFAVTIPCIWMGVLSLIWEMITSIFRCACVSGFLTRFWGMFQWSVFAVAATFMFTISLVPLSYVEHDSHVRLWPAVRQTYDLVDRFQLVNSYGLFRRMTGVGGRPEVVLEGSYDGVTWKEIEFMYKPGNVSAPPAVVTPHQPRLDWQMWFAALGAHTQAPWFTSLVYRLLQGKADVIELIQTDVSQYPFHQQPPTYVRAHRYRYWFTERKPDGSHQARWWRRVYDEEFYPMVHLGHTYLENMLSRYGLKDKLPPRHPSNNTVVQLLSWTRSQVKGIPAHTIIWTMLACSATWCFLMGLISNKNHTAVDLIDEAEKQGDEKSVAKQEKEEEVEKDQDVCTNQEGEEEEEDRDGDEQDKEDEMEK